MGLFFSNIHIRKNDQFDLSRLEDALIKSMASQGYQLVDSEEDSELSAQICCDDNTEWVSVASDFFDFQTPEDTRSAAEPLSVLFQTDVLAVTCVDSDFMMLNLINEADGTDAWINVGMPYDDQFPRRTGFRNKKNNVVGIGFGAWENKVTDYDAFQSVMQAEYTFAEDGSYVWYWEDKEFAIPEKVDPGLSLNKYLNMEQKQIFGVRFVPHGNPRKMLDIVVFIAPLENNCQKGAACWYAWRHSSDKAAYIEEFNKNWKGFDDSQILDPNDFDL